MARLTAPANPRFLRRFGENLFYFAATQLPDPATLAALVTQTFYMEKQNFDFVNG